MPTSDEAGSHFRLQLLDDKERFVSDGEFERDRRFTLLEMREQGVRGIEGGLGIEGGRGEGRRVEEGGKEGGSQLKENSHPPLPASVPEEQAHSYELRPDHHEPTEGMPSTCNHAFIQSYTCTYVCVYIHTFIHSYIHMQTCTVHV